MARYQSISEITSIFGFLCVRCSGGPGIILPFAFSILFEYGSWRNLTGLAAISISGFLCVRCSGGTFCRTFARSAYPEYLFCFSPLYSSVFCRQSRLVPIIVLRLF